ncbi:MAG: hypothetical protein ABL994_22450 [Verrucomicrobiales bacterium]
MDKALSHIRLLVGSTDPGEDRYNRDVEFPNFVSVSRFSDGRLQLEVGSHSRSAIARFERFQFDHLQLLLSEGDVEGIWLGRALINTKWRGDRQLWQMYDEIDEDYAEAEIDRLEVLRLRRALPLLLEFS